MRSVASGLFCLWAAEQALRTSEWVGPSSGVCELNGLRVFNAGSPPLAKLPPTMMHLTYSFPRRALLGLLALAWPVAGSWAQGQAPEPFNSAPNVALNAGPVFDVLEFEVEGNTVLPATAVEEAITPYLGLGKGIADVEGARAALEKRYQDAGFLTVFVDLPEQRVQEGIVRLKVLEGQVARLKVSDARYYDQGYIRNRVPELAPGKVPNFNVVQAQLADLNRSEERRVQPVLRPGPVAGSVEADLKVTDRLPVSGSIEINNRQVQFTRPLRLQATARYNNLFQEDHSFSLTAITVPQDTDQSKVLALSYMVPLPKGDAWMSTLVLSDSLVEPLGATNVVGKGFNVGVRRIWALPNLGGLYHTLTAGLDYKDTQERINSGGDGSSLSSPLRYAPMSLNYSATVQSGEATSTVSLGGVFAMRAVLRSQVECFGTEDQFRCKREDGDGSFAAFTLDATHTHPLGSLATARWRLGAQFSDQPLVGAEQFAIGGVDSVRGYYEAEALGDLGAHAGLELSGPNWGKGEQGRWLTRLSELQAYGFAEAGLVRTKNPGAGEARRALAGVGMGLRLRQGKAISGQVDVAWPLRSTDAITKGHPRVHARLGVEF